MKSITDALARASAGDVDSLRELARTLERHGVVESIHDRMSRATRLALTLIDAIGMRVPGDRMDAALTPGVNVVFAKDGQSRDVKRFWIAVALAGGVDSELACVDEHDLDDREAWAKAISEARATLDVRAIQLIAEAAGFAAELPAVYRVPAELMNGRFGLPWSRAELILTSFADFERDLDASLLRLSFGISPEDVAAILDTSMYQEPDSHPTLGFRRHSSEVREIVARWAQMSTDPMNARMFGGADVNARDIK